MIVSGPLFITVNTALWAAAVASALAILYLASRHTWLVAQGPRQARLRLWMAFLFLVIAALAISGAVFNLVFV